MYNIGKSTSPLVAMSVAICNGFSAYRCRPKSRLVKGLASPFALCVAAALCVLCIIQYMVLHKELRANAKLLNMCDKAEIGMRATELETREKEMRKLFMRWKGMNFIQAAIVGAGALLSSVATWA